MSSVVKTYPGGTRELKATGEPPFAARTPPAPAAYSPAPSDSPLGHFAFVKIDFEIIMWTPLLPSTTCVMWRSAATLASM